MQRISTNLTLFYKFFIPVFWIVFFGAFTVAIIALDLDYYGQIPGRSFRIGALFFFAGGVTVLYLSLMRLKRVEMDKDFVYVTNYFKHFRYPHHNIEKITESHFLIFRTASIYFKTPGYFGKRITFVPSNRLFELFWEEHPELKRSLFRTEEE